jgi:hypothetical protein
MNGANSVREHGEVREPGKGYLVIILMRSRKSASAAMRPPPKDSAVFSRCGIVKAIKVQ